MSFRCVGAWGGHEPPSRHAGTGSPQGLHFARSAPNLLFASEVIQMDGVPTSPSGIGMSETVTAHARLRDASARQAVRTENKSADGSRGGPAARSVMSNHQNHAENGTFSAVAGQSPESQPARRSRSEVGSEFFPILPADVSAGDSAFRFLGSKTDPILHVSYPSPWNVVADFTARRGENRKNSNWRREWDSNPRYPKGTPVFETGPFVHSGTSPCTA